MPPTTLRDRVREALAAREPTAPEARADLDAILRRPEKPARPPLIRLLPHALATGGVFVALLVRLWWLSSTESPDPTPRGAITATRGVHLYLRRTGEPESQALVIDLSDHEAKKSH